MGLIPEFCLARLVELRYREREGDADVLQKIVDKVKDVDEGYLEIWESFLFDENVEHPGVLNRVPGRVAEGLRTFWNYIRDVPRRLKRYGFRLRCPSISRCVKILIFLLALPVVLYELYAWLITETLSLAIDAAKWELKVAYHDASDAVIGFSDFGVANLQLNSWEFPEKRSESHFFETREKLREYHKELGHEIQ